MPFPRTPTHFGFSDESNWNHGQYRSIALVTMSAHDAGAIGAGVQSILQESSVSELKWHKVSSAKGRFAAEKVCDFVCAAERRGKMRIDAVIWDIEDSRHKIAGRDDSANLERMYYHLIRNVIELRWPSAQSWHVRVDQRNNTDWGTLERCLGGRSRKQKIAREPFLVSMGAGAVRRPLRVEQAVSEDDPLVQVADLFAGLSVFSWNKSEEHHAWKTVKVERDAGQRSLFDDLGVGGVSNNARFKHDVLNHVLGINMPGVVMKTDKKEGLRTYDPRNPINFWLYEPHRSGDKAPRRLIA